MKRNWVSISVVVLLVVLASCAKSPEEPEIVPQPAVKQDDYLSPELRAKVEKLKADVAREPTTRENVRERVQVLWEWVNAYSLQDGVIPVDLPSGAAVILSYPETTRASLFARLVSVDRFVRELQVREEWPEAIGALTNDATEPFPAGSWQTIRQTYTVGEMGMATGGGIMVAKHFMSDHGPFQRDDPAGDNYVTIACSNPNARFANTTAPMIGMHGGFLAGALQTMVFQLEEAALTKGDTITITYGDRSGGSQGFLVQTYANDFFPLPVYVDLEGKGNFFTLPIRPYAVKGVDPHAVKGFAPSVVKVGEPFEISVRTEDFYYNRSSGSIPGYEVLLNGEKFSTIPAGDDAITVLSDLKFDKPGVYRFEFRSPDGKITGDSNPIWVQENPTQRVYWGELHAHGGLAEGLGTPTWYFRFGREDARLDFLALSEHDLWMDDSEWELLKRCARKYDDEGKFIVFLGYEWTMRMDNGGHHNVYFRSPDNRKRVGVHRAPTLSDLYLAVHEENDPEDVLIIPHCHQVGDWRMNDPDLERLVEIMSMHGTFRWFGERYIERGYQMGFVAGSDDHVGHPGYTGTLQRGLFQKGGLAAVMAPEKTSDAIFSALRNIATYATSGERMILDVTLNDEPMGARAKFSEERRMKGQVMGTAPIDTITVFKNGEEIWNKDYLTVERGRDSVVQVSFESSAEEFFRECPRGFRYWTGTLDVIGADIVSIAVPGFQNRYAEFARLDEDNKNRVHFATGTRGRTNAILLELKNIKDDAMIDIQLETATEIQSTGQTYRSPATIPAERVKFRLADMKNGRVRRDFKVDRYQDNITLRSVNPAGSYDRQFEVVDRDPYGRGDYYYVRVKQLDGALAWSSPIWVGGVPPT
jgi:hypothetical protein